MSSLITVFYNKFIESEHFIDFLLTNARNSDLAMKTCDLCYVEESLENNYYLFKIIGRCVVARKFNFHR